MHLIQRLKRHVEAARSSKYHPRHCETLLLLLRCGVLFLLLISSCPLWLGASQEEGPQGITGFAVLVIMEFFAAPSSARVVEIM